MVLARDNGKVKLSLAEAKSLNLGQRIASTLMGSVIFEVGTAKHLRTSYLSSNNFEIELIRNLTADPIIRRKSALMGRYLSCLVPFSGDIKLPSLIKLRKQESDAFILFRAALNEAINTYKESGDHFDERDAQAVYSDIIQPRLATLDNSIRIAKRRLAKSGYRKAIAWTGALSLGMYTGFAISNPLLGLASFAAAKCGADYLEEFFAKSDVEDKIVEDSYYFLWKVRETLK